MSKINAKCSIFLKIVFLIIFIHFCTSAPINIAENAYIQFITELNHNKCSVPSQVQLPFDTAKVNNFEYLSSYLEICQKTELTKRNKEAVVLCREIFDNMRNISCSTKIALPDIDVKLSKNICKDINAKKDSVPEDDKSLLKRLTDNFLCDIMCDSEFEKACQVLLWSFEVQKLIASVANAQEPEQTNEPEDGENMSDNFKQDNTVDEDSPLQTSVDSESEKENTIEVKDISKVTEPNKTIDLSEPQNSEDNLEQKLDAKTVPGKNVKQEKFTSNNKGAILGNQTLPKAEISDFVASKPTNNFKSSTSLSQQMSVVQTSDSDTEVKLVSETTKDESGVQNLSKQIKNNIANSPVTQLDKVNDGSRLSEANIATAEQTQNINPNTLSVTVQDTKDTVILPKEHLNGNSYIPGNSNVPSNDENSPVNEMHEKDQNSKDNELLHESEIKKTPNDAAAGLLNNRQISSNLVGTLDQNKLQSISSNDDKLAKKEDAPSTGSQTVKDINQQQTNKVQEKTSIARDETETDQFQIASGLKKAHDYMKTDASAPGLITDDETMHALKDQKKTKVVQQTKELDSTISNPTSTPTAAGAKQLEKSQKSKATVINSDGKSVIPSSLTETSTKTTVVLEKMEGGSDLRQPSDEDHFGEDLENTEDEEYSKSEYDGGLYEVSKNKESNPNVPSPITVAREIISSEDERLDFPPRNSFGQDSSDIQMIAAFPEQEDSHFFFYFLSIVLILMAGYLIFHNKQKIIALIVEGRHERNRRSHRVGYKKLETK